MRQPSLSRLLPALSLCASGLMAGCASSPPPSKPAQEMAASAQTVVPLPAWDALATGTAERLVNRLSELPAEVSPPPADSSAASAPAPRLSAQSFQIVARPSSAFDHAMLTLVTQRLQALGMNIEAEQADRHIELSVQLIERPAPRQSLVLISTQVRVGHRLHASTADLYAVDATDLPLFTPSLADTPTPIKTWRMVAP